LIVLQVATLSWIERKLAGTLFAEPPTATYPEAVEHCLKAESLSPMPWKENRLLLAKCHINQGKYADAVSWLRLASQVPVVTPDVSGNITYMIMLHDLLQWLVDYISIIFLIGCCLKYSYMYIVLGVLINLTGFLFLLFVLISVVMFETEPACFNVYIYFTNHEVS
jgi:hypothetical protein